MQNPNPTYLTNSYLNKLLSDGDSKPPFLLERFMEI